MLTGTCPTVVKSQVIAYRRRYRPGSPYCPSLDGYASRENFTQAAANSAIEKAGGRVVIPSKERDLIIQLVVNSETISIEAGRIRIARIKLGYAISKIGLLGIKWKRF